MVGMPHARACFGHQFRGSNLSGRLQVGELHGVVLFPHPLQDLWSVSDDWLPLGSPHSHIVYHLSHFFLDQKATQQVTIQ